MNYLFYDLETTGLCESFDQIVRFAGIITDENLREIDRHEISVKLRPDVVPSPEALIITRLGIDDIKDGVSEYDALLRIHKLFNRPNQINLGYNSLKFDNTMIRFGFYRNLLDPYSHQYKNNTYRADVMNINLLYYLFKSDVLEWNDEKPMKLENINSINSLFEGKSHDAMVDVIITLELSRKLRSYDKRMWDYLIAGFIKSNDILRLKKLPSVSVGGNKYPIALYTDITLGYESNCCCAAILIGQHKSYSNQSLWMKIDYPDISEYFADEEKFPRILKRKDGEPSFVLPLDSRYSHALRDDRSQQADTNISWLNTNPEILENFIEIKKTQEYDNIESLDLDASIYQKGIFLNEELSQMQTFHSSGNEEKAEVLNSTNSSRIKDLGMRVMFRNFPSHLDDNIKADIKKSITQSKSVSLRSKSRRTPLDAIDEANQIINNKPIDDEQKKIIQDFVLYLQSL